jgi:hypothetical protein
MLSSLAGIMAEISYFAEKFGIPVVVAAALLLGLRPMADGGRPYPAEPVVVGESGPELFVPDRPGTVLPQPYYESPKAKPGEEHNWVDNYWERQPGDTDIPGEMPNVPVRSEAWGAWINHLFERWENIEDRRTPEQIQADEAMWAEQSGGPKRPRAPPLSYRDAVKAHNDRVLGRLKEFPPAPSRLKEFPPAPSQPSQEELHIQAAKDAAAQQLHNEWSRRHEDEERIRRGDEWLRNLTGRPAGNTSWPGSNIGW